MTRFSWWRGALVVLSWILWPLAAFLIDLFVRLMISQSRACSIEGCDFTPNVFELVIYFAPPVLATGAWWRWRQSRTRHAG